MLRLAAALIASSAGLLLTASTLPDYPDAPTLADEAAAIAAFTIPQAARSAPAPAQVARALAPKPAPPTTRQALQNGVLIVVSLPSQRMFVFKDDGAWGSAPVSTGRHGHDTPAGVFPILQKSVDHRSTLYNDAPMPYMQRLTWGGVALHAGSLPGYRASHGCIRLPRAFAKRLYRITSYASTAVLITRQPVHSAEQARELGGGERVLPTTPAEAAPALELASTQARTGPVGTIQLGASPTNEAAADLWQDLVRRRPQLASLQHVIVPATVKGRAVFRLRATGAGARAVCGSLSSDGTACFPVGQT